MKKLLTLFAFLFMLGMCVNFSPGDPGIQDQEYEQVIDQGDVVSPEAVQAEIIYMAAQVPSGLYPNPIIAEIMVTESPTTQKTAYLTTAPPLSQIRIDKHIDPGICSLGHI